MGRRESRPGGHACRWSGQKTLAFPWGAGALPPFVRRVGATEPSGFSDYSDAEVPPQESCEFDRLAYYGTVFYSLCLCFYRILADRRVAGARNMCDWFAVGRRSQR